MVREYIRGNFVFRDRWIWKKYDVEPFLLLPPVLDLRLLFRELFIAGAHLLSSSTLVGAEIALRGLITQVYFVRFSVMSSLRSPHTLFFLHQVSLVVSLSMCLWTAVLLNCSVFSLFERERASCAHAKTGSCVFCFLH